MYLGIQSKFLFLNIFRNPSLVWISNTKKVVFKEQKTVQQFDLISPQWAGGDMTGIEIKQIKQIQEVSGKDNY